MDNRLDIVIFCQHFNDAHIELEPFYQRKLLLVGHPKCLKQLSPKELTKGDVSELNALPWLMYDECQSFMKEYYQHVFQQKFTGKVILTIADLPAIITAAVAGMGITVLPSYYCEDNIKRGELSILYQPPQPPNNMFYLGWKKGGMRFAKIKLLYELLKESIKNH